MDERDVLFGLHELPGIGWKTIEAIVAANALPHAANRDADALRSAGIEEGKAARIVRELTRDFVEERKERYRALGYRAICRLDPDYPALLAETPWPPWVLYVRGDARWLAARLALAVVGTRAPTQYGRKTAEALARKLAEHGWCVVSGMARGIDTAAHRGALAAGGGTIAVLGTPPDRVYPPENVRLLEAIAESGLVATEYPLGTKPQPGLFPRRNRIIAGLSLGTLVVEGSRSSGALITADYALEASRDVFAVPGPITWPQSAGPNALIRQGAKLVTGVEDILEEYVHMINLQNGGSRLHNGSLQNGGSRRNGGSLSHGGSPPAAARRTRQPVVPARPDGIAVGASLTTHAHLSPDERSVLAHIAAEPVSIDELQRRSRLDFGHLHSILLSLTMKKQIEQLPGFLYIRS